jgi:hypothetical protein
MHTIIYFFIIVILIISIIYLVYNYYQNITLINRLSNVESNGESKIEGFTSLTTSSLINLGGNPLIKRNMSNISASPSNSTGSMNVLLGTSSTTKGWIPPSLTNSSMIISLNNLTKITAIATSGIRAFRMYSSNSDASEDSFQEVLYTQSGNVSINSEGALVFETGNASSITIFNNLISTDREPVFAKYLKVIPFDYAANTTYESIFSTNPATATAPIIHPDGMKVEVFGITPTAKPSSDGKSLLGSYMLYNENGNSQTASDAWVGESGNRNPKLLIKFGKMDGTTFNPDPKSIYSITFEAPSSGSFIREFKLIYSHFKSKITETIENINGNTNLSGTEIKNKFQFIFDYPIIATELILIPTLWDNSNNTSPAIKIVDVHGDDVTNVQEKVLLEKNKNKYCTSDSVDGCGSISDLLGKQSEIQQLCDALELQDQIKENNQRIQKNRQYILQLEEQDQKIANLEQVVDKMKHLRDLRQTENDTALMAQKDKQSNIDKQLQELIKDRQNKLKHINLNVNLNGETLTKLESAAASLPAGNSSGTTPVEGFENFIGFVPKQNTQTTQTRQTPMQKPTEIPLYDYSSGFYYRPYSDDSYIKQVEEDKTPDLRVFGSQDPAYKYEKPCTRFYENKTLSCNGGRCDTNVKMLKKMM